MNTTTRRPFASLWLLLAALITLALAYAAWRAMVPSTPVLPRAATAEVADDTQAAVKARLAGQVQEALVRAIDSARASSAEAIGAGEQAATPHFNQATQGIGGAVAELTSFGGCVKLTLLMARDRVSGGTRAEQYIQTQLNDQALAPFLAGSRQLESELSRLQDALSGNTVQLAVSLAAILAPEKQPGADPALAQAFTNLATGIQTQSAKIPPIANGTTLAAAGLGVSGLFITSTYTAAKKVIGVIVERLATTNAAAVTAAAVAAGPASGPGGVGA